jgi:uncharacterized membrane protein YsdA (DUF1294 family)
MLLIVVYIVVVNVLAFFLMGIDKSQARRGELRVPEKRLFAFAASGGALGTWLGMRIHRHKTKHMSFVIGLPILFVLNVICVYCLAKMIVIR